MVDKRNYSLNIMKKIIRLILYLSKSMMNKIIQEDFFFQISFQFACPENLSFENLKKQIIDEP